MGPIVFLENLFIGQGLNDLLVAIMDFLVCIVWQCVLDDNPRFRRCNADHYQEELKQRQMNSYNNHDCHLRRMGSTSSNLGFDTWWHPTNIEHYASNDDDDYEDCNFDNDQSFVIPAE